MNRLLYFIHGLLILIIVFTISGAFQFQLFLHEEPCPLCWLQRLGMLSVATSAMLNLRMGFRMGNYAMMLASALFGGSVAVRQTLLHICPGSPTFGTPIFGLSLYVWSGLVFVGVVVFVLVAMILHDRDPAPVKIDGWFGKIACIALGIILFANIFDVLVNCGLGPCQDVP
jgi:disulfide bond formation protein DsbB